MAEYHVSPSGNDSNPGTLDAPWATFAKADGAVAAGDTVFFHTGEYYVHEDGYAPLTASSADPANPITLRNYPGETPVLHGGLHAQWTAGEESGVVYYSAPIPVPMQTTPWWHAVIRKDGWCATPIYRTLKVELSLDADPTFGKSSGLNLAIAGTYEATVWDGSGSQFIRRYNTTCTTGSWLQRDVGSGTWRLYVRGADGLQRVDGWWEKAGTGDDPPEGVYTAVGVFAGTVTISNVESVDDLPGDFLSPPTNAAQGTAGYFWDDSGTRLLFDLSYANLKTNTIYLRPADIAPALSPPVGANYDQLFISSLHVFYTAGSSNLILNGLTLKHGLAGVRLAGSNLSLQNLRIISSGWQNGIGGGNLVDVTISGCYIDRGNGWLRREMGGGYGDRYWQAGHYHGIYVYGENITEIGNFVSRFIGSLGITAPYSRGVTTIDDNIIVACQRPIQHRDIVGAVSATIEDNIAIACLAYRYSAAYEQSRNKPITYACDLGGHASSALVVRNNYLETHASPSLPALRVDARTAYLSASFSGNTLRDVLGYGRLLWIQSPGNITSFVATQWFADAIHGSWHWLIDTDYYTAYGDFQTAWTALGFGAGDVLKSSSFIFPAVEFSSFLDADPTIEEARAYVISYTRRVKGELSLIPSNCRRSLIIGAGV